MSGSYDALDMVRSRNGDDRAARRRSSESEERPAAKESAKEAEKPKDTSKKNSLDREKTCPLLLRVFCSTSRHNPMIEYNRGKKEVTTRYTSRIHYRFFSWLARER